MDYLRHHADCNGQVGAVGFGAGGRLAFLLAARFDPEAAVAYDGAGIEAAVAEAGGICTPFLLHLALDGSTDPAPALDSIRNGLKKKRMVTLHEYPGRRPGFVRPGDDNHDPAAAELANLRTVDFLVRHL